MNQLDTNFNGGYPIELDDFRFLDEIYRTGIHQVMQSLSSFAILTGCDAGGTDVNGDDVLNAGWVVVNGEIGYLPQTGGLDLDIASASYGIIADNYLDNSVIKVTQAGQSIKPHKIRQFKLEPYQPSMGEDIRLKNIKQLKDTLRTEFGLDNQLKRSWKTDAPSAFSWNATNGRWESVMAHELTVSNYYVQGFSVKGVFISNNVMFSLPNQFSFELDGTNLIIIDSSPNPSNDDWRGIISSNGIKVIFELI
tara:strand:- start:89 stop:841 length:753 start_codon:yes stop_codon:yes gene_type:complete